MDHQRVFWEVSGTFIISFLLNVYTFVCAFLGQQSNWWARWTVWSELTGGRYCCYFFFIKNGADRIHGHFDITEHQPASAPSLMSPAF